LAELTEIDARVTERRGRRATAGGAAGDARAQTVAARGVAHLSRRAAAFRGADQARTAVSARTKAAAIRSGGRFDAETGRRVTAVARAARAAVRTLVLRTIGLQI